MNLKSVVAALVIAAVPVCAQAQKPAAAKVTKADAQKVVTMIGADKAKTQIYCDMIKLGEQIEQADQKKDNKKTEALAAKMDEMSRKLGPEYIALMDGLQETDANSQDGKDIGAVLDSLDALCTK